jgi:hypothetical protein
LSEAAASSSLRLLPALPPLLPTQEDGPSGMLPQRAVNVSPLVVKCRRWNPSYPVPNKTDSAPSPLQGQSPLERIADLLENLPTKVCVELICHLLSTASSLEPVATTPNLKKSRPSAATNIPLA